MLILLSAVFSTLCSMFRSRAALELEHIALRHQIGVLKRSVSKRVWDGSGLWVCAKRLEKGRFRWPAAENVRSVVMRPEELAMLLNGLDAGQALPRKNWLRRAPAA